MAPPINKPKLRPISPEVMKASQAGGAPSVRMTQSARKAIIDSTAPNYDGMQVARGVPGSVVPANSNAIKAIFRPEAPGDDPIIERPVGPVVINPNGPIGEPGRLVDGYNGNPMVAMDDYFSTVTPDYRGTSPFSKSPDPQYQGTRPFTPAYNSTRVPGEPLTNTDRFVDRVDMEPDKTQLYIGSSKYTDEAPGAMEAAQRALYNTIINRPSYTKTPTRLTPEEQYTIGSSLTADGVNPGAFEINPGVSIRTRKKMARLRCQRLLHMQGGHLN